MAEARVDAEVESVLHANWNYPTNMIYGAGRINELAALCERLNIKAPLLITDSGLKEFEFIKRIQKQLNHCAVFCDVKANPNGKNVRDGVTVYNEKKCDGVIAVGGGSGLDAAKAIALMAGQNRSLWDFEDVGENYLRVNTDAMAPVIAIPTTAGTGSEVGRASVIVDDESDPKQHCKKIIFHPNMLPSHVILDPELTTGLPAHITAATGIDAFVHAFEAYCAPGFHPMADGIALKAMALIKQYLPIAVENGHDLEARGNMLVASSMGATAFQKGLGGVHALAHPLGAIFDKHHGLLNAILLPYVIKANEPAIGNKMPTLCAMLDLEMNNKNGSEFYVFFNWVLAFRKALNIPHTLKEIGIDLNHEQSSMIGELATQDAACGGNPIQHAASVYQTIFEHAVDGVL